MINDRHGIHHFVLGVGGTATIDAGLGALHALGLNVHGRALSLDVVTGADLVTNQGVTLTDEFNRWRQQLVIEIACDVLAPLTGPSGAVRMFGAQKGASTVDQDQLEEGMNRLAANLHTILGTKVAQIPGGGAAGGIVATFHALLNARIHKGMDIYFELSHFDEWLNWADVIITGEGCFDQQSLLGKSSAAICSKSAAKKKPLVIVCGSTRLSPYDIPHQETSGLNISILDLASRFPMVECMQHPKSCLLQVAPLTLINHEKTAKV